MSPSTATTMSFSQVATSSTGAHDGSTTNGDGGECVAVVKRVKKVNSKRSGPTMVQTHIATTKKGKKNAGQKNKKVAKGSTKPSFNTAVITSPCQQMSTPSLSSATEKTQVHNTQVSATPKAPQSATVSSFADKHPKLKPSFLNIMASSHQSNHVGNFSSLMVLASIQTEQPSLSINGTMAKTVAKKHQHRGSVCQTRSLEDCIDASSVDNFCSGREGDRLLLASLPAEILGRGVLSFLGPSDLVAFGSASQQARTIGAEGYLWEPLFHQDFESHTMDPVSPSQWKTAYRLASLQLIAGSRCFRTKKTFVECVLGVGLDFTVNPKTKAVDYIRVSQDLVSGNHMAASASGATKDTFDNILRVFLPLHFTDEHFQRALPQIHKAVSCLAGSGKKTAADTRWRKTACQPDTILLDVFCKIINTFVVMLSDEGVSACEKSFRAFTRIHRLFLALAKKYPSIQKAALSRLRDFIGNEDKRQKKSCPNVGWILPLLMIVDETDFNWAKIRRHVVAETFDRCVLWICKKYPYLETTGDGNSKVESPEKSEERVTLSREAMRVPLRLLMLHVYFLKAFSQGTILERSEKYDRFFFQRATIPEHQEEGESSKESLLKHCQITTLSFESFRNHINAIYNVQSWQKFFRFIGLFGPKSKQEMAQLLQ